MKIIMPKAKIIKKINRDRLEDYELKILEKETENEIESLEHTEKTLREKINEIDKVKQKLEMQELIIGLIS